MSVSASQDDGDDSSGGRRRRRNRGKGDDEDEENEYTWQQNVAANRAVTKTAEAPMYVEVTWIVLIWHTSVRFYSFKYFVVDNSLFTSLKNCIEKEKGCKRYDEQSARIIQFMVVSWLKNSLAAANGTIIRMPHHSCNFTR